MRAVLTPLLRLLIVIGAALMAITDVQVAFAQSSNCSRLASTLTTLNRNRDFRELDQNIAQIRAAAAELQDFESVFVRGGCQKQLNDGDRLSRQCRNVARRITRRRADYNDMAHSVENGQAVAQQRELALQQIARFGCSANSSARVTDGVTTPRSPLDDLFNRLFGTRGRGDIRYDDLYGFGNRTTLRSVCVRSCDGYFWPVSFSTLEEYLPDDAGQCHAQCPGAEVELYYHRNPGETTKDMISMSGQPYSSSPNAFRYQKEFDASCTCKQQVVYGSIALNVPSEGGQSRAQVSFEDSTFPLPLRDPRRTIETVVAEVIVVPLPRRRPLQPGEEAPVVPFTPPVANAEARIVTFGDRKVRLVGPDTPYGQSTAAGS